MQMAAAAQRKEVELVEWGEVLLKLIFDRTAKKFPSCCAILHFVVFGRSPD
jgi:hypothetical protein